MLTVSVSRASPFTRSEWTRSQLLLRPRRRYRCCRRLPRWWSCSPRSRTAGLPGHPSRSIGRRQPPPPRCRESRRVLPCSRPPGPGWCRQRAVLCRKSPRSRPHRYRYSRPCPGAGGIHQRTVSIQYRVFYRIICHVSGGAEDCVRPIRQSAGDPVYPFCQAAQYRVRPIRQ